MEHRPDRGEGMVGWARVVDTSMVKKWGQEGGSEEGR